MTVIAQLRYVVGVITVIALPLGLLYWLIIHPFAPWWRRLGSFWTCLAVLPLLAALGAMLFRVRGQLLGRDFGTNWLLIGVALVLCVPMLWLEKQYSKQLKISVLVGIPEFSSKATSRLLREGIYSMVRHPRYLSAGIGLMVNVLIANYLGCYLVALSAVPLGYVLLALEERELVGRFGDAYRQYQREVPQLIPRRLSKAGPAR
jgi:protein-S-isoprenylcysteine O-methyltransferase Ste14